MSRYFRAVLRSLVNPITIPVVLGMIVWAVRSNVTTFPPFIALVGNIIAHWTTMMGRAATSAALFVIGMSMYGKALFGVCSIDLIICLGKCLFFVGINFFETSSGTHIGYCIFACHVSRARYYYSGYSCVNGNLSKYEFNLYCRNN